MSQIQKIVTLKKYGFFKKVTTTYPLPLLNFILKIKILWTTIPRIWQLKLLIFRVKDHL